MYTSSTAIVGTSTPRSKYVNARQGVMAEKYTAICTIELPSLPLMICRGLQRRDRQQVVRVVFALRRQRAKRRIRHDDHQRKRQDDVVAPAAACRRRPRKKSSGPIIATPPIVTTQHATSTSTNVIVN